MNTAALNIHSIYYRLIALWVLCEAMLGGIIHGLKLPVSGMFVGSAAVVIICMMGYYVPTKGSIFKATIIVCVFKMMLSPHSPPPAYFAVCFQGLLGQLLLFNKKSFRLSCLLLAVLALAESALQRILVLVILYGNTFWAAVDEFLSKLTSEKNITSYSYYAALAYTLLHVVAGVLIGWFAGTLPNKINQWSSTVEPIQAVQTAAWNNIQHKQKRKKRRLGLWIVAFLLLAIYLQSSFSATPILSTQAILLLVLRSVLVMLGWYLIVRPIASKLIQQWLNKRKLQEESAIQKVNDLLPSISYLVGQSWKLACHKKGLQRFVAFCKVLTVNLIYAP